MKSDFLVLKALLPVTGPSSGEPQRGSISVVVTDQDGTRPPGAQLSAEAADTPTQRTAITDAQGAATLAVLDPSSSYVVTASLDGYNSARQENVQVVAGQATSVSFSLSLG